MYVAGVAEGFRRKLEEERQAMEIERDLTKGTSGGTALALRGVADETLAQYKKAHPEIANKHSRARFAELAGSKGTLAAGVEAGRRLNLNKAVGGKGQKKIG